MVVSPLRAQMTDVEAIGRALTGAVPPPEYYETLRRDPEAFRFSRDNGFIVRALGMAGRRAALRAQGAAMLSAQGTAAAVEGELNVPVFLILYDDTDPDPLLANVSRDVVQERLYGTAAAPPYSVHSYYREISGDRMLVNGTVLDWTRVAQPSTYYEGTCNGLGCTSANVHELMEELVSAHDAAVDFSQFDGDGDGFVDAVVLIHPDVDGACGGNNNIWAHRFNYNGWVAGDSTLPTNDGVDVNDYIIQGGQGGNGGCTPNEPLAMGIVAHETGHLFGLPDLYNTGGGPSEGIGHWGLMGSGNWRLPASPAHMESWSRAQLGWVTEVMLERDTTLDIDPVHASDTAFVLSLPGSDEYFLLENRQRLGSDVHLWGHGLVVWHIDPVLVQQRLFNNGVNAAAPEAVALKQADGAGDLQFGENRGDAGDPFPGLRLQTVFSHKTNPSSARNDGSQTFIILDSIPEQVAAGGAVHVRIRFGIPSLIAADDTLATFTLDGDSFNRFEDVLETGQSYALDMPAVQLVNDDRNRYTWVSWSDGGARMHTFTAAADGDTITADVDAEFLIRLSVAGTGAGEVTVDPAADLSAGSFLPEGASLTLAAVVTGPTTLFDGWAGDTAATADTLVLDVTRPLDVTAWFVEPLAVTAPEPATAVAGAQYRHEFAVAGGRGAGSYFWQLESGELPTGLRFLANGVITGIAGELGEFPLQVSVMSGLQRVDFEAVLSASAPALSVDAVFNHLVGTGVDLSDAEADFLDLIGNVNGRLDVGDFLAWLDAGGEAISAERMAELVRALAGSPAAGAADSTPRRKAP